MIRLRPGREKETTAVPLVFHRRQTNPGGAIELDLGTERRFITRAELPSWVTIDGNDANSDVGATLLDVRVGHDSPGLPGVAVIDTPGAGGLSEIHAKRAMATAEKAAILLAVTDANGRLTRAAIDFLRDCAKFTHAVTSW